MIGIFKKYAPQWNRAVTRFAHAVWKGEDDDDAEIEYNVRAWRFAKAYRHALEKHYAEKGIRVYRGTVTGWVNEWLKRQQALKDTLRVIAADKKNKLYEKEMERLKKEKNPQAMIDRLFEAKENETVYKVFSFKENFEAAAGQIGDESAYDLGTGINERIIQTVTDRYYWKHQNDTRVRPTHEMLGGKCFLFSDPPTTIDKYGNRFKGNPGLAPGCRCWAEPAPEKEKVLRGYVVRDKTTIKKRKRLTK